VDRSAATDYGRDVTEPKAKAPRRAGSRAAALAEVPTPEIAPKPDAAPTPTPIVADEPAFEGQYRVQLPTFEGPLDMLLHLIQQHELDILDIPVSFITEKYLTYLKVMQSLTIDLASEYLVMAATLTHIKSKMLLPAVPKGQEEDGLPGQEEEDPRAELVRRLLEYQKYKAAGADLADRGTLGRDVFPRGATEPVPEVPAPLAPVNVFALLDAFDKILKRTSARVDHEVVFDRISITDRIVELTDKLSERRSLPFEALFEGGSAAPTRFDVVITFLALLEMCRMHIARVYQSEVLAPLYIELVAPDDAAPGEGSLDESAAAEGAGDVNAIQAEGASGAAEAEAASDEHDEHDEHDERDEERASGDEVSDDD
jgi:segregation and condensation protein A